MATNLLKPWAVGVFLSLAFTFGALSADAPPAALTVAKAGPTGEVSSLSSANEVRVVFSQPMVALGRIPDPVQAPYFKIVPPVPGSFRWSGTTILIFTPDKGATLPFATKYTVTVDASAASLDGKELAAPYTFSFTTPTVKLLSTDWYRQPDRFDSPAVVVLHFNQPVRPEDVVQHTTLIYASHEKDFDAPSLLENSLPRLKAADPKAQADFQAKLQKTLLTVRATEALEFSLAQDWDKKRYPPSPDMVVLITKGAPPPDSWFKVRIDKNLKGLQGPEIPQKAQSYTIKTESAFFVTGFRCAAGCDPENTNYVSFRGSVEKSALLRALKVVDVTEPGKEAELKPSAKPKPSEEGAGDEGGEGEGPEESAGNDVYFDALGFDLRPAHSYAVIIGRDLKAEDGQSLGYTWLGVIENWHAASFCSFEGGHGVWESAGGPQIPFSARNLKGLTQWLAPLKLDNLMPTVKKLQVAPTKPPEQEGGEPEEDYSFARFSEPPPVPPAERQLKPEADVIQAYALNLKAHLSPRGTGLVWAALREGEPIPKAYKEPGDRATASLIQVTNLGISVKDSPENTLVFVTRLDSAQPVEGAKVAIRDLDNKVVWSGLTDKQGLALAPDTDLRDHEHDWKTFWFIVTAEKDDDAAYVCSDWNDGIEHWAFGTRFDLNEAKPLLRGALFADRGVYKLGEEVHLKAVLRSDTANGMLLLPAGTSVEVVLHDSHGGDIDKRTVKLNEWSAADWTVTIPEDKPMGNYSVAAKVEGQRRQAYGSFLVAAYRRPDFRVDANLGGEDPVAGAVLKGVVTARYLFGAPMAKRSVSWTFTKTPLYEVPQAVTDRFSEDRWAFLRNDDDEGREYEKVLQRSQGTLDAKGQVALDLQTEEKAGVPCLYTLEGEVTDLSRQTIAGRSSFRVHPAPWYIGLEQPPYFAEVKSGLDTKVVAASYSGAAVAGVKVAVSLVQIQWISVRKAEGKGFYAWECERKEIERGHWDVATAAQPAPLHIPLADGGYYVLKAQATDERGRSTATTTNFYALGPGYTAWARYDNNRIDLVPEKKTYKPGDTARILIKSPWEKAQALLTTEREGIKTSKTFALDSTQQTVSVPLTEANIPNVFVSVLLVKGRTEGFSEKDTSDPGKPAFRLGYCQLKVEDTSKRLDVHVATDKEEYRPAAKAKVDVDVKDAQGRPDQAEVTLWAVDYGVLSLTAYKTPSLLESVWVDKALQVMNEDSRERIISRRVITPKGADEGGGGGAESGPGTPVRKDFRVLSFWLGSLATDAKGHAATEVTLPESLTTYRVMAVVHDKASRFGWGQREFRISKPVLLRAAFPRFLALGDKALFGSVVNSQLKEKGTALVTMKSLDPAVLEILGDGKQTVDVEAKGASDVRFNVSTKAVGTARLQMSVKLLNEEDAFEDVVPVRVLVSPEVVAAYGQAQPEAKEQVEIPAGVVPSYGGLRLELSSTAMVGLGEGARYLVDYPYGCAEQRASCALALLLAADLGDAFSLPGIEAGKLKETVQKTLKELEVYQCSNGGFVYWKGDSPAYASAYLTSYVLHVMQRGGRLGYTVSPGVLDKGYGFLEGALGAKKPENEGWWPSFTAWQAFATKVLAEGGRNVDSHLTRLYGYADRMPVFGLAYLYDAMAASGEKGDRPKELSRRIHNAILPEAGASHIEELNDPYLMWFWSSNVRSTAIALGTIVRNTDDDTLVPSLVRWLMQVRKNGRWGNTQENAIAMESLVDYYRKYEKEVPDFSGVVTLGAVTLTRQEFKGRSAESSKSALPMPELLQKGKPGEKLDLSFKREGTGTLFYVARLKYASDEVLQSGLDMGFRIERAYAVSKEGGDSAPATSFKAGDIVKVTLKLGLTKERRFVVVMDPIPAGFEPVESWFATTSTDLARQQEEGGSTSGDWTEWFRRGGFDHVERHDDHIQLFATRLSEGEHVFSYICRATTAGTFKTAPSHAEEMYNPEVFGRTKTDVIEVKP